MKKGEGRKFVTFTFLSLHLLKPIALVPAGRDSVLVAFQLFTQTIHCVFTALSSSAISCRQTVSYKT